MSVPVAARTCTWKELAVKLGTGRTYNACCTRYNKCLVDSKELEAEETEEKKGEVDEGKGV